MDKPRSLEELVKAAEGGNSGAQYNLGVCYLRGDGVERDAALARQWLQRAADTGLAPAQAALGYMHLRADGVAYDPAAAALLFAQAAGQGYAEGLYKHAEALATGLGCNADAAAARAEFTRAAEAGHPVAQCQLAYCLDEGIGGEADPAAATAWLYRAAQEGSPRAAAAVAERYRTGHTVDADGVLALAWFLRAENMGYPGAAAAAAELRGQLDDAAVKSAEAASCSAPEGIVANKAAIGRLPGEGKTLSESPRIERIANLLSPVECWHLMAVAGPLLRPSRVLSSKSGETVQAAGRSSGGMSIVEPLRDVVVWNIERRLAALSGLPLENGEPLVILRYGPGDEYRPHFDFFDPDVPGQAVALDNGGQRLVTILIYLCDVAGGGSTDFPDAGVTVRPQPGAAVMFHNCTVDGQIDRRSRHAGMPVTAGQKWLATKWVRQRRFDEFRQPA